MVAGVDLRERFRAFPLDGALLFFQPATGRSVRIENEGTRRLSRHAPRVVMFGVTNRCNLRCGFCSRDTGRESQWTVPSAAAVLGELSAAGTLEVAFGGGEPFAFRGFEELISELHASTPLALHVTTNGTLLDAQSFAPFRGKLGQVRLSVYDDQRWRVAARALYEAGQLWGANVLVDDSRLETLPALFAELAALGCHDVSLLSYVGGDPLLELSAAGRQRLAVLLADAPLTCRISVCFGDRLAVPRLFDGMDGTRDCGAGYDFITVTSDQRVQSCSFQDSSLEAHSAQRILEIWRSRREYLRQPSPRRGCARGLPLSGEQAARRLGPALALWRAFSGNNSGECILVGRFESSAAAQRYLAELAPGWAPDEDYSAEWRALFERENVVLAQARDDGGLAGRSPSTLLAIGRSVMALSYDSDDAFPELRALTWKRSGFVVPGGIHVHESPSLVAAIGCRDSSDARALLGAPEVPASGWTLYQHGEIVLVRVPDATKSDAGGLVARARQLEAFAGGRRLGAELFCDDWDETDFTRERQRLGSEPAVEPRLLVGFHGPAAAEHATRFAASLSEADAHALGSLVLVAGIARRKRAAVLALRQGARVIALDGRDVQVDAYFWHLEPPRTKGTKAERPLIDLPRLTRELAGSLGPSVSVEPEPNWRVAVRARLVTPEPLRALTAMQAVAELMGTQLNSWASDLSPMAFLLRRLLADVRAP